MHSIFLYTSSLEFSSQMPFLKSNHRDGIISLVNFILFIPLGCIANLEKVVGQKLKVRDVDLLDKDALTDLFHEVRFFIPLQLLI